MSRLGGKCNLMGTPAVRTPFVFCTMLGHDNPYGRVIINLTLFHSNRVSVFQGCTIREIDRDRMRGSHPG
jgi:hypothetical protein